MFDELVNLDEKRLIVLDMLIRKNDKMTKTYHKKVKPKALFSLER